MNKNMEKSVVFKVVAKAPEVGFDPEMLFVECSRCGNPIVWERGRSTEILLDAGIDPLELDAHCLLVTDGCPRCSSGGSFHVQILRVQANYGFLTRGKVVGHA